MRTAILALGCGLALGLAPPVRAQSVEELDPHVTAAPGATPGTLVLTWEPTATASGYTIRRRVPPVEAWTQVATLPGVAISWEDPTLPVGQAAEYHVMKTPASGPPGNAYLLAGVDVPFRADVGDALIVVDAQTAAALAPRIDRLEADLRGDGWGVERLLVAAAASPPEVKARIAQAHVRSGERVRAVLLLGAVPRPFSGYTNPDGHPDHRGAWPADGYYGDFREWTDMLNLGGAGPFANTSGDGKFDHSTYPDTVELMVGRVDATGLPAFAPLGAHALLARYLDRNHAYRHGVERVAQRAYVRDDFGYFGGEAFARIAWRDSAAVLGATPQSAGAFFDVLEEEGGWSLAFGCGGGTPTSAAGIGTTGDFVTRAPRATFLGLFGSYFGDWAYEDNLMRAALVSPGSVMATAWFARPYLHLHGLGALRPFGEASVASANNSGDYDTGLVARGVHQALLGDPTLRLFVVRPPDGLTVASRPAGAELSWGPSEDEVDGYHVFRRAPGDGELRLTAVPLDVTGFVDTAAPPGVTFAYRVVAVKRVATGSGTFFQHSQGMLAEGGRLAAPDAGTGDVDGGEEDGGGHHVHPPPPPPPVPGCGCAASAGPGGIASLPFLLVLLGAVGRRRVARARRH